MTDVEKVPALGISIQAATGAGTQIVFQTHVDLEMSQEALNTLLDRLTRAADRQRAKVELLELEKNLKVQTDQLRRMREDRARIEQLAPTDPNRRLPKQQEDTLKSQRSQADANEKRMTEIIGDIQADIERTKATIAKDD